MKLIRLRKCFIVIQKVFYFILFDHLITRTKEYSQITGEKQIKCAVTQVNDMCIVCNSTIRVRWSWAYFCPCYSLQFCWVCFRLCGKIKSEINVHCFSLGTLHIIKCSYSLRSCENFIAIVSCENVILWTYKCFCVVITFCRCNYSARSVQESWRRLCPCRSIILLLLGSTRIMIFFLNACIFIMINSITNHNPNSNCHSWPPNPNPNTNYEKAILFEMNSFWSWWQNAHAQNVYALRKGA